MAITTGAADTGVLNLDMGSRPRAGMPGDGDSFANALDTHLQKPRSEAPARARVKPDEPAQPPAAKEKNDAETTSADARDATGKPAEKETEVDGKGDKKEGTDSPQNLVALILQSGKEGEAKSDAAAQTAGPSGESGKLLPQAAANDPAAALVAAAVPTQTQTAETAPTRTVDPRLTAAQAGDAAVVAPDAGADHAVGKAAGNRPSEALLQTGAAPTPGAPAAGAEKGDSFAATLAALREVATPRPGGDANAPVSAQPMAAAPPATNTPANATAPVTQTVNVPVGQQGWDQAVGERVLWMTRHGLQEAKIELNPRDLGPIEVKVSVQQDQASVAFTTHSPAAREALEAAMPRLRDMLADSGLNLAQSDVSHRSPQQQSEGGWGNGNGQHASGNLLGGSAEEQPVGAVETPLPSLGAVDYYA